MKGTKKYHKRANGKHTHRHKHRHTHAHRHRHTKSKHKKSMRIGRRRRRNRPAPRRVDPSYRRITRSTVPDGRQDNSDTHDAKNEVEAARLAAEQRIIERQRRDRARNTQGASST